MEEGPRLRMGPRVLSYLMDRYNSWNHSVEEFISGIKVTSLVLNFDKVRLHVPLLRESLVDIISCPIHRSRKFAYILHCNASKGDPCAALDAEIYRRKAI